MDYLRHKGLIDLYAVGGNGGSLAQRYWPFIPFPNFPKNTQKEIVSLYYNSKEYDTYDLQFDEFIEYDNEFNNSAGIYELDTSARLLKTILNKTIDDIVNERNINFSFTYNETDR